MFFIKKKKKEIEKKYFRVNLMKTINNLLKYAILLIINMAFATGYPPFGATFNRQGHIHVHAFGLDIFGHYLHSKSWWHR